MFTNFKLSMLRNWLLDVAGHLIWYARQCFPFSYWLLVRDEEGDHLVMWRMWFGFSFDMTKVLLETQPELESHDAA